MTMMNRHNMSNLWNGIDNIISNNSCLSSDKFFGEEPSNPSSIR